MYYELITYDQACLILAIVCRDALTRPRGRAYLCYPSLMQTSLLYNLNNINVATTSGDSGYARHKIIQVQFLSKPLEKPGAY